MKKKLYYHPKFKKYLIVTVVGSIVMEDFEHLMTRRYLRCNYKMPSYNGYKLIGNLE